MSFKDEVFKRIRDSYIYEFYYHYVWRPDYPSISAILDRWAREKEEFSFIQVGANDGYTNDPVYKYVRLYDWEGVLIEPQREVFEDGLKETYKGFDNVKLANVAIDSECGSKKLYKIGFSDSKWATGLSSFDKEMVEKQYKRGYVKESALEAGEELPDHKDEYISTETIQTLTFDKLIEQYNISEINGLFIDAEGFDYNLIRMFNFKEYKPGLVMFEHQHMTETEEWELIDMFRDMGYSIFRGDYNTLAHRPENLDN